MIHLFFALFPDPTTAQALEGRARLICEKLRLTGVPISADRLHVTLHGLGVYRGEPPAADVTGLRQAAAEVRFPRFQVKFDQATTFVHRGQDQHPFVVKCGKHDQPELRAFRRSLGETTILASPHIKPASAFTPHLSLFYDENILAERPADPAVSWSVRDFALVKSMVGHSRYEVLGRWPLQS